MQLARSAHGQAALLSIRSNNPCLFAQMVVEPGEYTLADVLDKLGFLRPMWSSWISNHLGRNSQPFHCSIELKALRRGHADVPFAVYDLRRRLGILDIEHSRVLLIHFHPVPIFTT